MIGGTLIGLSVVAIFSGEILIFLVLLALGYMFINGKTNY